LTDANSVDSKNSYVDRKGNEVEFYNAYPVQVQILPTHAIYFVYSTGNSLIRL